MLPNFSILPELPNNTGIRYTISHTACYVYRKYPLQLQFAELGFIDLIIFPFPPSTLLYLPSPLEEQKKKKTLYSYDDKDNAGLLPLVA